MIRDSIRIEGAREHNLQDITLEIPRERLTVVTGLSGSGKSSLAFDTLYAEGQRRYVESLSAYARQFLGQLQKPDVDHIEGLSPAIAVEQRTAGSNPRSIVATSTEIHDYLRLLFAGVGQAHCPSCRRPVRCQSAAGIVATLMAWPNRTRLALLAPLVRGQRGKHEAVFDAIRKAGFVRVRVDGDIHDIDAVPPLNARKAHDIDAVVDRLIITNRIRSRLTDSVETALQHGNGVLRVVRYAEDKTVSGEDLFSERLACPDCGISFDRLTSRHFSFNSHYGACPTCSGLGSRLVFDETLIVPDPTVSINDGAIVPWRKGGRRLIVYYKQQLRALTRHYRIDADAPYESLGEDAKAILMHGSGDAKIETGYWRGGTFRRQKKVFEGIVPNLVRRHQTTDSQAVRMTLERYMSRRPCPDCHGARLRPEVLACTVDGASIVDVTGRTVSAARAFFAELSPGERESLLVGDVLKEIRQRLHFLEEVGLGYVTLDRQSGTLSGGEAQRIRLATQIGSGLHGVLYVLDEPSIGLHQRDNARLIAMLQELRDRGNTVVVVEHDEAIIRAADHIVDMGPGAGREGGHVLCSGDLDALLRCEKSLTARYLKGESQVRIPTRRHPASAETLVVVGARHHNLKGIDVAFPLGTFVCVTGVSGSGKSSLIDEILRRALFRHFYRAKERPGAHTRLDGLEWVDKAVVIDQSPVGRTPRSNPATYTGAFDGIRKLFAATPAARVRGYGPGRFSFNAKGGRCEICKGDGLLRIEMHFLPDVYAPCEQCGGQRYNPETLEIRYGDRTIADVLGMTIDEAMSFFEAVPSVHGKLRTLSDVGLGYLQLGQSATTLSGGEAQRVKLARELSKKATGRTIYLLDEPTTGLHFADVQRLLDVLHQLRDAGNTVVVVEHNLDVIKAADHIIDLGPEGGTGGGHVVAAGTPEEIAACPDSITGTYIEGILH